MPNRAILVTGATGKQGGAVINALLDSGPFDITVLALTRDATSSSAKKLETRGIKVVQGDFNDITTLFANVKKVLGDQPLWGVYSVQTMHTKGGSLKLEEQQGKAFIDGAIANKAQFFVQASSDRGGDKSFDTLTGVQHFDAKYRVEHHVVENAKGKMQWCILRPVAFMENYTPDMLGKILGAVWKSEMDAEKAMQLVAVKDIGWFGAQALLHPEEYAGRSISLAGDSMTFKQANEMFKRVTGKEIPMTFNLVGQAVLLMMGDFKAMFKWLNKHGGSIDIDELKKVHPALLSFEEWLKTESAWKQK